MKRSVHGALVSVAIMFATAACKDSNEPGLPACIDRIGGITVSVVTPVNGPPEISWTPACRAREIAVYHTLTSGAMELDWWITTGAVEEIVPKVRYGVTPRGVTLVRPAWELDPGREYVVELSFGDHRYPSFVYGSFTAVPPAVVPSRQDSYSLLTRTPELAIILAASGRPMSARTAIQ